MANYAIMRMAKVKSAGAIRAMALHNRRDRETSNADRKGIIERVEPYAPSDIYAAYRAKIAGHTPRKNAVHAVEVLCTASPEWWLKAPGMHKEAFIEQSKQWLEATFTKQNIIAIDVHYDEKTPHLHAVIVPVKDGKLNANHFIGGSRDRMRELQDGFYESVKDLRLDRGQRKSKAKHKDIRQYYATIGAEQRDLEREVYRFTNRKIRKPSREDIERVIVWATRLKREHEGQLTTEKERGIATTQEMLRYKNLYQEERKRCEIAQGKVIELQKTIKNQKDYTIDLLHKSLNRLGYNSHDELNKQHEIATQEQSRKRDRGLSR